MSCELFISWNPDLVAFHLGPLSFRWYSLCWLFGLALAYIVVKKLFRDQKIPEEKFDPLFIYCFLGILIGARLGHCLFYQPEDYLTSVKGFIEMLLPIHFTSPDGWDWKLTGYEGLASHGGTLGLILALLLYVRRMKVPLWQVLDNIAIATGITACFIRLGNLMNSEIIGSVTSVPWAFEFVARDGLPRHPAQLYEAIAYGLLFFIMLWLYKRHKERVGTGFYFGLCLTYIFTFRFFVEFFKKEQVDFEVNMLLDMGQLLSIPFILVGAYYMRRSLRKAAVLLALFLPFAASATAQAGEQALYGPTMRLGRMLEQSGNMQMAAQCYQQATNQADEKDIYGQLMAQLGLVSTQKFSHPVEAQRLNDDLAARCRSYPECQQLHLALECFLSFCFNNRETFAKADEEYVRLCTEDESLPTTYDIALQAMDEAMAGYYDQALKTLDKPGTDPLTRRDLRIIIFERTGNMPALVDELRKRADTVDSLSMAMYEQNASQASLVAGMAKEEQKAAHSKGKLLVNLIILAAFMAVVVFLLMKIRRKDRQLLARKDAQLKTALKMAGETDEMKHEFVRRVSHEIRTPLNAIAGFNDILNNPDIEISQEEKNELLSRINENVKAITTIVDEMLLEANDESVADYARDTTVLCNHFFRDMLYKHRTEVNADVQLEFTTQVVNRQTIKINADAVTKVMEHLILNAIKFTPRGIINLNCSEDNGMLRLALTDTGCGIPPDKQESIFEHFSKGNEHEQGIGLGLTVARNMAQKLGGNLTLDKEYADGARFILKLPME